MVELTIMVDPRERTARLREVHALAAGDVYSLTVSGVPGADTQSLRLALYRDASMRSLVAATSSFSDVPGHSRDRDATLDLGTLEAGAWFDAAVASARRASGESSDGFEMESVLSSGWLLVYDGQRTWASCRVPVVLRKMDPGASSATPVLSVVASKIDRVPGAVPGNVAVFDSEGGVDDVGMSVPEGGFAPASSLAGHVADRTVHHTLEEISGAIESALSAALPSKLDAAAAFAPFVPGSAYAAGDVVSWRGGLYRTVRDVDASEQAGPWSEGDSVSDPYGDVRPWRRTTVDAAKQDAATLATVRAVPGATAEARTLARMSPLVAMDVGGRSVSVPRAEAVHGELERRVARAGDEMTGSLKVSGGHVAVEDSESGRAQTGTTYAERGIFVRPAGGQERVLRFPASGGTLALKGDLGGYLPKTGGTVTGDFVVSSASDMAGLRIVDGRVALVHKALGVPGAHELGVSVETLMEAAASTYGKLDADAAAAAWTAGTYPAGTLRSKGGRLWEAVSETSGTPGVSGWREVDVAGLVAAKMDATSVDDAPSEGSPRLVTSGGVWEALQHVRFDMSVDDAPSEGSPNLVTSGGVWEALQKAGSGVLTPVYDDGSSGDASYGPWWCSAEGVAVYLDDSREPPEWRFIVTSGNDDYGGTEMPPDGSATDMDATELVCTQVNPPWRATRARNDVVGYVLGPREASNPNSGKVLQPAGRYLPYRDVLTFVEDGSPALVTGGAVADALEAKVDKTYIEPVGTTGYSEWVGGGTLANVRIRFDSNNMRYARPEYSPSEYDSDNGWWRLDLEVLCDDGQYHPYPVIANGSSAASGQLGIDQTHLVFQRSLGGILVEEGAPGVLAVSGASCDLVFDRMLFRPTRTSQLRNNSGFVSSADCVYDRYYRNVGYSVGYMVDPDTVIMQERSSDDSHSDDYPAPLLYVEAKYSDSGDVPSGFLIKEAMGGPVVAECDSIGRFKYWYNFDTSTLQYNISTVPTGHFYLRDYGRAGNRGPTVRQFLRVSDRSVSHVAPAVATHEVWEWTGGPGVYGTPRFVDPEWTIDDTNVSYNNPVYGDGSETELTFVRTETKTFTVTGYDSHYDEETGSEQAYLYLEYSDGDGGTDQATGVGSVEWNDSYGATVVTSFVVDGVTWTVAPGSYMDWYNDPTGDYSCTAVTATYVATKVVLAGPGITVLLDGGNEADTPLASRLTAAERTAAFPDGYVKDSFARLDLSGTAYLPDVDYRLNSGMYYTELADASMRRHYLSLLSVYEWVPSFDAAVFKTADGKAPKLKPGTVSLVGFTRTGVSGTTSEIAVSAKELKGVSQ